MNKADAVAYSNKGQQEEKNSEPYECSFVLVIGGEIMKRPMDRLTKMNLYFLSFFLFAALIFLCVMNYKNVRYSRFGLSISGTPTLSYDPMGQKSTHMISPSFSNGQYRSYDRLRISWWADKSPAYLVDKAGFWFKATSTMNGNIILKHPDGGTPLGDINFDIRNAKGKSFDVLVPGKWYKIKQYGHWYSIKFQWDK